MRSRSLKHFKNSSFVSHRTCMQSNPNSSLISSAKAKKIIFLMNNMSQGRLASLYSISPEILPVEPIPKEKVGTEPFRIAC